jgi:glycosyltransferase involved in cell wall biosynthesis
VTLLSIVVPAYNEEHTVGDVTDRLKATLREIGLPSEIIVVNDYSTDRTVEVSMHRNVKVCSLNQHMGKGYALRAGFAKAKGEIIVTIDSDGSNRPEELPLLLKPVLEDKADLLIGSRFAGKQARGSMQQEFVSSTCSSAFSRVQRFLILSQATAS